MKKDPPKLQKEGSGDSDLLNLFGDSGSPPGGVEKGGVSSSAGPAFGNIGGNSKNASSSKEKPVAPGGPQIRLDAQGNIVLDESSLLVNTGPAGELSAQDGDIIPRGKKAPKKQIVAKWSEEETNRFFHALQLYGEDLFMIQTHIPLRTPAQIKTKWKF